MAGDEEDKIRDSARPETGARLDHLSVFELEARIQNLREEITRLEMAKAAKIEALKQASSFFKS